LSTHTHTHTHMYQVVATDPAEVLEDITVPKRESNISAWVNVIYGCNEKCSYCVVPYTRCIFWCFYTFVNTAKGSGYTVLN